jgi:hypothetical protein
VGTQAVYAGSFSTFEVEAGAWDDDGPDSLSLPTDSKAVRWQGTTGGLGEQYVQGDFGPVTPTGTDPDVIVFTAPAAALAGGGYAEGAAIGVVRRLFLADDTLVAENRSTIVVTDPTTMAAVLADGCYLRQYGTTIDYLAHSYRCAYMQEFIDWTVDTDVPSVERWPLRQRRRKW